MKYKVFIISKDSFDPMTLTLVNLIEASCNIEDGFDSMEDAISTINSSDSKYYEYTILPIIRK